MLVLLARPTTSSGRPDQPFGGAVVAPENIYLGAYNRPPNLKDIPEPQNAAAQQTLGRPLAIDGHYYEFLDTFPIDGERADAELGQIPLINWQPNGIKMAEIGDGRYDDMIRARASELKDYERPVLLRFAHEMNGDWYSWSPPSAEGQALGNTVADYIDAWRHIHRLFGEVGVTNVSWVWCPNAVDFPADNAAMQYYPGDAFVDWIGVDAYNFGAGENTRWRSFSSVFGPIYERLPSTKPVILAEFGSAEAGGSKADWLADMVVRLRDDFDRVRAVVFFDEDDFKIDTSTEARQAARKLARDSLFDAMPPL
ncbi:MAG: glycosyl hydrolase [Microlunatus sp.]